MANSATFFIEKLSSRHRRFRDVFAWLARRKVPANSAATTQAHVVAPAAAPATARPPEEVYADFFNESLPMASRLDAFVGWCVRGQGFRYQGDLDLPKFPPFTLPETLAISSPVRAIEIWRLEGRNSTELLVLLAQNPPVAMSDIGVVVFRQNIGQNFLEAYEAARTTDGLGCFKFSDIATNPTFHALDIILREYGGLTPVKPPVAAAAPGGEDLPIK